MTTNDNDDDDDDHCINARINYRNPVAAAWYSRAQRNAETLKAHSQQRNRRTATVVIFTVFAHMRRCCAFDRTLIL
jgi:hypothetical protein